MVQKSYGPVQSGLKIKGQKSLHTKYQSG